MLLNSFRGLFQAVFRRCLREGCLLKEVEVRREGLTEGVSGGCLDMEVGWRSGKVFGGRSGQGRSGLWWRCLNGCLMNM